MNNKPKLPPFPVKTFEERMTAWWQPVAARESGVVIFPVRLDRLRRFTQFLRDHTLQKSLFPNPSSIQWFTVSVSFLTSPLSKKTLLTQLGVLSPDRQEKDLDEFFFKQEKDKQFVIVLTDPEGLYCAQKEWVLSLLNDLAYQFRNISIVQLLERDILHSSYSNYILKYASLFNHVCYAPLYSRSEIAHFIRYLCEYFGMTHRFNQMELDMIYDTCGGHPWLVKEVVRFFLTHPQAKLKHAFDHEELLWMVDSIWQGMMPGEQSVLRQIATGLTPSVEDTQSRDFLERMRIIETVGKKTLGTIKLLDKRAQADGVRQPLVMGTDGDIRSAGVVITDFFSPKEHAVLASLHKGSDAVVLRGNIGQSVWGDDGFSDWALDRLMSRIRKKLKKLGYPADYIQTIPGKGFRIKRL